MTNVVSCESVVLSARSSALAHAMAERLDRGARALAAFASTLTDAQWRMPVSPGGRTLGVVVHHVASVYPIEIQLAELVANGQAVTGVTWEVIHKMNADHAREHAAVTKADALDLLARNSSAASAAIRSLSDEQLACATAVSLYADAPLTAQFVLEDHAVRHSYHHLAQIRRAVGA